MATFIYSENFRKNMCNIKRFLKKGNKKSWMVGLDDCKKMDVDQIFSIRKKENQKKVIMN